MAAHKRVRLLGRHAVLDDLVPQTLVVVMFNRVHVAEDPLCSQQARRVTLAPENEVLHHCGEGQ
eukprot:1856561-Lingulodinium_polyedra.AAC.1